MKKAWQVVLIALGAWAIWWFFAVTGLLHPIVGPIAALFGQRGRRQCLKLFGHDDRAGAVLFGYSGEKTLSWECGHSNSIACRMICASASFLLRQKDHCKETEA